MVSHDQIREAAEADLYQFIRLVSPERVLGACHEDLLRWWERENAADHQLVLLPRDHQKSAMIAYRVAWYITKDPTLRVLYISATSRLAEKQLGFIKQIIDSDIYRTYWPDHINPEEGRRTKWTSTEIVLDHPERDKMKVAESTVFTAGLTTTITGFHCDIAVLDDVVVNDTAYSAEGRDKVKTQYSLLASIESTGSKEWIVGTRYDPRDLYSDLQEMQVHTFNDLGEVTGTEPLFEIHQKVVEDVGDGTGEYLWPRQRAKDGRWYGFDIRQLAIKREKYIDKRQFRAQYYNDPTDPDDRPIDYDKFQYYDKNFLRYERGTWYYQNKKLNLVAAMDFAYSTRANADYSAIVVVGVDADNLFYVLDIERFRTKQISEYFNRLLGLYNKWGFRKLRAEVTAAQQAIVTSLKEDYIRPNGLAVSVQEVKPTRHEGSKEERMEAVLSPRYDNMQVYHYKGGNCQVLEDELVSRNPPHDDIKDALANAIEGAVRPSTFGNGFKKQNTLKFHPRFGGKRF